jgi:hypothetical protein
LSATGPKVLAGFHRAVAETLATVDVPDASPRKRAEMVAFAMSQLAGLPTHTAVGVTAAATLLAPGFEGKELDDRVAAIERWGRSKLPSTQLYLRLMRSLVLFKAYDTTGALA